MGWWRFAGAAFLVLAVSSACGAASGADTTVTREAAAQNSRGPCAGVDPGSAKGFARLFTDGADTLNNETVILAGSLGLRRPSDRMLAFIRLDDGTDVTALGADVRTPASLELRTGGVRQADDDSLWEFRGFIGRETSKISGQVHGNLACLSIPQSSNGHAPSFQSLRVRFWVRHSDGSYERLPANGGFVKTSVPTGTSAIADEGWLTP
jgi:hypothetical protein